MNKTDKTSEPNKPNKPNNTNKNSKLRGTVKRLREDRRLRAEVLLYFSLAVNLTFAVLQGINGILYRSVWAGTLAFYYLVLGAIRFSLLHAHKRVSAVQKWKKYRRCALVMLTLELALLGIQSVTLYMGHVIAYRGYMIYAIAAYTFYSAIAAIRNVVVYRKYNDPVLSASKALSLAVAAISIYSLQSAMISTFGDSGGSDGTDKFKMTMGLCVGAGVFVLIFAVSVFMLVKGTREIRRERDTYGAKARAHKSNE